MSNKKKHLNTNLHKNYITPKELTVNEDQSKTINQPVLQAIKENDYELNINDFLNDYNEKESHGFWKINYSYDNEKATSTVEECKSRFPSVATSNKKRWVYNIFYNNITSYEYKN